MSATEGVVVSESARVRVIRLCAPPGNLLTPAIMTALHGSLQAADSAADVTGVILTGDDDVFCGGLDVAAIRAGGDPVEFACALVKLLALMPTLGTPVVAAVNGDAVASGASLVAACDYAVAVPDCRVGTFEVSIGIWPMIAQVPIIARIGARPAMENIASGVPFPVQRALDVGLVQRVVPAEGLLDAATQWLSAAARAGSAGAAGRRSVYELAQLPYADALDESLRRFVAMFDGSPS